MDKPQLIIPIKSVQDLVPEFQVSDQLPILALTETFIKKTLPTLESHKQKNLTAVPIKHNATRKTRLALVLAPMWAPYVAPYGISRIAGLARHAGFETQCWDLNIQCYNATQGALWHYLWDWKWANPELYDQEIHPLILPTLEKYLDEIVEFRPTVVGFTMYYTNNKCTTWLVEQLKQRIPGVTILAGGPQSTQAKIEDTDIIDHYIRGEGELLFSQLLENIENNDPPMPKILVHDKSIRIDLDSLPIPDYRDFDIDLYQFKGIASELSRGCIAKCQFCSETTFWRYRGRSASSVLDEVEYNYKTFGIRTVWFIDSLVNGNLKELLTFAQGLIDRDIKIKWAGFARNDGRMDKQYLSTLLRSGCSNLMVGIESGSQKVLDLIQKKVKVHEIEQNFNDLAELNATHSAGSSWFVGFPGELPEDVAHTLTLVWRLRNSGVGGMGFGICNQNLDTPLFLEKERFNISPLRFGGNWFTGDWANTIAHRIIRYKSVCILQDHYRMHRVRRQHLGQRCDQTGFLPHYHLTYDVNNWVDDIPYETEFDFNIIKTNINPLADTLVNEIWPLLRVLWLAMGAFKFDVVFDPELDHPIYGDNKYFSTGSGKLWANYKFDIDSNGAWSADFYTKLEANYYPDGLDYNFEHAWTGTGTWPQIKQDHLANNTVDIK